MEEEFNSLKKLLQKNGYKLTLAKRIILKAIIESKNHLNVKEIYERVKRVGIGLATIYRTLKVFSELGIVKEININGTNYYEMKIFSRKPLHIHFKCFKCNSIIDVESQNLNFDYLKLNKRVEAENALEIYDSDIMFTGVCSKCREGLKCQGQRDSEE